MIRNKIFLITLLSVICSFWIFWYPGVKVATDYHLSFNAGLVGALPWSWREFNVANGMGEYTTFTLWSQALQSLSEVLSFVSLSDEVQTRLVGFVIIVLGFIGLWKLLAYWKINDWGKGIGATFFILNSFFLLMFDGGQFSLNLVYITLPFVLLSFMNLLKTARWKERVKFSLMVLLVSILDIRVVFLLVIILGLYLIFKISYKLLPNLLISFVLTSFILIGFHAYWIFPSILSKMPNLPLTYERLSQVNFLSFSSIGHSIFLQQPHWYKNIFGQINQLKFEFIAIPTLVFLVPILIKKKFTIGFWLIIATVGIFLSKGSQDPLPGVYLWLFGHFPGFFLFRDPVKFYFLTALAYSVLLAISVEGISKLKFKYSILNKMVKIVPVLVLIYLIWLVRPVYLGQMTGMFSTPLYENEYFKLADVLEEDKNFSRVFWIPTKAPLGFSSPTHPSVEASRLVQKRPFAAGVKGTYETFNFLREASFTGELFDVAGIGYIVYPYLDPRRDNMHPDNIRYYYTFLNQLSNLGWVDQEKNSSPIPLLKTKQHQDRFFITSDTWWIIGSDDIYAEATKSARLKLAKNSFIFAEEYPGLSNRLDKFPEAKIVLNNKSLIDLAASFVKADNLIFPANKLDFHPDKSGWWKREAADLIDWRTFLQSKYGLDNKDFDLGGGWAVGEGSLKLKVESGKLKVGDMLLARVFESTRSGQLGFYQEDKLIGQIDTKEEGNNVMWFEVGKLVSDQPISLESSGDINIVNALGIIKSDEWQVYKNMADDLFKQGRIVDFKEENTLNNLAEVKYQKINPTKYKVTVSNLTKPELLVFSESYDALWKMGDQTSFPVYSLLNGFRVDRNGEYVIEFEAQKYVYPGLIISSITLVLLIFLLLKTRRFQ